MCERRIERNACVRVLVLTPLTTPFAIPRPLLRDFFVPADRAVPPTGEAFARLFARRSFDHISPSDATLNTNVSLARKGYSTTRTTGHRRMNRRPEPLVPRDDGGTRKRS